MMKYKREARTVMHFADRNQTYCVAFKALHMMCVTEYTYEKQLRHYLNSFK